MTSLFEDLKSANKPGVFLLKNEPEKSCYVGFSSNISKSLIRLINSNMFFPEFDFSILEIVTDLVNLRPRCQYFKDLYYSNGYSIINPKRISNLKVSITVINDFRSDKVDSSLFLVELLSGAYKRLSVGVFETYESMDEFLYLYYPGKIVTGVIYSNNKLTEEYLKYESSRSK